MSIIIDWAIDPAAIAARITDGWTIPTLWVADSPEGPYTVSAVAPVPATLAAMVAAAAISVTAGTSPNYNFRYTCTTETPDQYFKIRYYNGATYSALSDAAPLNGGGGTTLKRLRQGLGKRIRDLWLGTTTSASGSASLANCNNMLVTRYPDSWFKGGFFNRLGTAEVTQISAFTQSGGVFGLSPACSTNVGTALAFEVTKKWGPDEYRDAINFAIPLCYPYLNRPIAIAGALTKSETRVYTVPQEILSLSGVQIESTLNATSTDLSVRGLPWTNVPFRPTNPGNHSEIEILRDLDVDMRLRFLGTGRLSGVYNDTDYTECFAPQTELIIYQAAYLLYTQFAPEAASSDTDRWDKIAASWRNEYESLKDQLAMPRNGQMIWGTDAWQSNIRPRRFVPGIAR